jgi:hypothetical protein
MTPVHDKSTRITDRVVLTELVCLWLDCALPGDAFINA